MSPVDGVGYLALGLFTMHMGQHSLERREGVFMPLVFFLAGLGVFFLGALISIGAITK